MITTVKYNYLRTSIYDENNKKDGSVYFRTRNGQRQIVVGSLTAARWLTENWGDPDGKDEKGLPVWGISPTLSQN